MAFVLRSEPDYVSNLCLRFDNCALPRNDFFLLVVQLLVTNFSGVEEEIFLLGTEDGNPETNFVWTNLPLPIEDQEFILCDVRMLLDDHGILVTLPEELPNLGSIVDSGVFDVILPKNSTLTQDQITATLSFEDLIFLERDLVTSMEFTRRAVMQHQTLKQDLYDKNVIVTGSDDQAAVIRLGTFYTGVHTLKLKVADETTPLGSINSVLSCATNASINKKPFHLTLKPSPTTHLYFSSSIVINNTYESKPEGFNYNYVTNIAKVVQARFRRLYPTSTSPMTVITTGARVGMQEFNVVVYFHFPELVLNENRLSMICSDFQSLNVDGFTVHNHVDEGEIDIAFSCMTTSNNFADRLDIYWKYSSSGDLLFSFCDDSTEVVQQIIKDSCVAEFYQDVSDNALNSDTDICIFRTEEEMAIKFVSFKFGLKELVHSYAKKTGHKVSSFNQKCPNQQRKHSTPCDVIVSIGKRYVTMTCRSLSRDIGFSGVRCADYVNRSFTPSYLFEYLYATRSSEKNDSSSYVFKNDPENYKGEPIMCKKYSQGKEDRSNEYVKRCTFNF